MWDRTGCRSKQRPSWGKTCHMFLHPKCCCLWCHDRSRRSCRVCPDYTEKVFCSLCHLLALKCLTHRYVEPFHVSTSSTAPYSNILTLRSMRFIFKYSVSTPQKTHSIFVTNISWFTLFRDVITVYSENRLRK